MITRAQLVEFLRPFREEGDGDEARFDRRVDGAIRAATEMRLLTPDPDADNLFTVSPAVVPLIGADEMIRMERYFVQAAGGVPERPTIRAGLDHARNGCSNS